jgi:hypothetical protein
MPGFSVHLFDKGSGNFSIDGALVAEYFINEEFFLQTGLLYTTDTMTISGQKNAYDASGNLKYSYNTVESFSTKSLLVPLLAGINFYPSIFSLSIYGGLYSDIPFSGLYKDSFAGTEEEFKRNILFGYAVGGSAGMEIGPGIMFLDVRYMGDFTNTKATITNRPAENYKRRILAFGIGYKIGFINQQR